MPETAQRLAPAAPKAHLWWGRPVKVYDGTTVLIADSATNQDAYPQHGNQVPGRGFPIARLGPMAFCINIMLGTLISVKATRTALVIIK